MAHLLYYSCMYVCPSSTTRWCEWVLLWRCPSLQPWVALGYFLSRARWPALDRCDAGMTTWGAYMVFGDLLSRARWPASMCYDAGLVTWDACLFCRAIIPTS